MRLIECWLTCNTFMDNNTFLRFHANLRSAFIQASEVCFIWRTPDSDQKYNAFEMEQIVKDFDAENPCPEGSCYEVSVEGAIGFCPGVQYLTRWLFLPCMDENSVTEFVEDMVDKLQQIKAEEEAPAARFCPNCGQPYPDNETRFCPNCGTPRQ